jgi:hypothetical protein
MKVLVVVVSIVTLCLAGSRPVRACDQCGPVLSDDDIAQGFYLVTKEYTGDTVTVSGPLTTYGFQTRDVAPTSIARDVAVVTSGQRSPFDNTSSNSRPTLSDGRPVGGTYVDSYTLDANGNKTFITRTFLADDAELAKDAARKTTGSVAPAEVVVPAPAPVPAPDLPQPQIPSAESPVVASPTAVPDVPEIVRPIGLGLEPAAPREPEREWIVVRDEDGPGGPGAPLPPPAGGSDVRAGVALAPQADVLSRIEVLRGRRVGLWIRGTVDGSPSRVLGWRLVSGDVAALGPVSGSGDDPFVAQWLHVGRAGDAFVIRFSAVVEVRGGTARSVPAEITVTVRSPALVE